MESSTTEWNTDLAGTEVFTFVVSHMVIDKAHKQKYGNTRPDRKLWVLVCANCNKKKKLRDHTIVDRNFKPCTCSDTVLDSDEEKNEPTREVGLGAIHLMMNDKSKFSEYLEARERQRPQSTQYPYK